MTKKPHGKDCEMCGEGGRTTKLHVRLDRRRVARWRLCLCCAALKLAAVHRAAGPGDRL